MKLTLIQVPYDSGHYGAWMGRGREGRGVRAAARLLETLAGRGPLAG